MRKTQFNSLPPGDIRGMMLRREEKNISSLSSIIRKWLGNVITTMWSLQKKNNHGYYNFSLKSVVRYGSIELFEK
jgi:hypothetical protein